MVYLFFESLNKQTLDAYPRYTMSRFIVFFFKATLKGIISICSLHGRLIVTFQDAQMYVSK